MIRAAAYVPFTPAFNASGQSAISLPLHWTPEGLPVGVQLVAAYGREDLLFRVAPRLTLEMSIQYQGSSSQTGGYYDDYGNYYPPQTINNGYDRTDVPVLLGARIHLGNPLWILSPYLVGAAGGTYSQLRLEGLVPETRWFFEAQGGIGADLRLGRHFSMSMDLRGFGRFRSENSQELYVQDAFGGSVRALGNSGGVVINFGIGGYF